MHSVHMLETVWTGKHHLERLRGKDPLQKCVPFDDTVLAKTNLSDAMLGIWLGTRSNSAECFIGIADCVFRAREIRRLETQNRRDKETVNSSDWSDFGD